MIKNILSLTPSLPKKVLLKSNHFYKFSSQGKIEPLLHPTFPYVFGGSYNQVQFRENKSVKIQMARLFDFKQVCNGFKQAYRSIVHSLAQNDVQTLKDTFEPNLLKKFKPKQVRLLNPDAEIEIVYRKGVYLLFGSFIRDPTDFQVESITQMELVQTLMPDLNIKKMSFNFRPNPAEDRSSDLFFGKIPVLFACEILFKSKMKLIPVSKQVQEHKDTEEIHSVQFEIQFEKQMFEFMRKALDDQKTSESFDEDFFGKNYEWKVGDVDRCLNGNVIDVS